MGNVTITWNLLWELRLLLNRDGNVDGNFDRNFDPKKIDKNFNGICGKDLELFLDSLRVEVSLGRSREWLPLGHIHLVR